MLDRRNKTISARGAGGGRGGRSGGGRGQSGGGRGQGGGNKPGAGPSGSCICPNCSHRMPHQVGQRCMDIPCPKCGTKMVRE